MDREKDNVNTKKLLSTMQTALETFPHVWSDSELIRIDPLEFERRDGFIPHSHNRGGLDYIEIISTSTLISTGMFQSDTAREFAAQSEKDAIEFAKRDAPNATEEEHGALVNDYLQSEYDCLAFRIRIMYEGDNTVAVHYGFDLDAPYFRWKGGTTNTIEINYKTKSELAKKLKNVMEKIDKDMPKL